MKIFICSSKHNYYKIAPIKEALEKLGHSITLPNSYDEPMKEEDMKLISNEEHSKWKSAMIKKQREKINVNDAILVLNFDKNGQENYIGGATFLEIFTAWDTGKKVFLYNNIPDNIFKDELMGINPIILNGDLSKIR
ncbi:MAG: hypothetical protein KKB21_00995 [Nanoarchaeota archaeon]|nr:hypothetical protein [Nanoarchaeota archaeon]MBU4086132.1 hypothetical protein [Nanoarchaeota archaeon]